MDDFFRHITNNGNWILQLNIVFAAFFLSITLGFVFAIIYLRISKIIKNREIGKQKELFSNYIMLYLFDTNIPSVEEVKQFKQQHIQTKLSEKIAVKVLLIFEENFKGETNQKIKELFYLWDLRKIVDKDLNSGKWYKIARAIYVAAELNLNDFSKNIEQYLDAEKDELRQQAILYFIQLSNKSPLLFLSKIKKPLTLWEQIYIEECLKSNYTGEIPDFSTWLNSDLSSVKIFSIKMIGEYNQYENIPNLLPFLESKDLDIKKETIHSLGNLGYPELLIYLKETFQNEVPALKSFILKTVMKIGVIEDVLELESMIPVEDWGTRQTLFKIKKRWNKKEFAFSTV